MSSSPQPLPAGQLTELADFAHFLADEAAQRLLRWFGQTTPSLKADGSVVTQADLEVDRFIHAAVTARFPDHGLLTEETSLVFEGAPFTWVVDPLDGTNNFSNGLPLWGCSLALLYQGEPLIGIVDFPALGQRWSAVRGQGAVWNGQPLHLVPPAQLEGNQFFVLDARSFRLLEINVTPKARILGCTAFDLALASRGVAVAACELLPKIWDIAAVWLILQEAGAVIAPLFHGAAVFPLQPGTDYAERIFPVLAAPTPALWQILRNGLHVPAHSQRLIAKLQAQGWHLS